MALNFQKMETAYRTIETIPAKPKQTKASIKAKSDIPDGYVSSEEFSAIFEQKLLAAYANL